MSRSSRNKKQDAKRRRAFTGDGGYMECARVGSQDVAPVGVVTRRMAGKPRMAINSHLIRSPNIREAAKAARLAGTPLSGLEHEALVHRQRGIPVYKLHKKLHCRPCDARRAWESSLKKILVKKGENEIDKGL